jgi:nicotinamidase-related amidase
MQKGLFGPNSWPEMIAKYNPEIAAYWNRRAKDVVIPNINRLTDFFRENDPPIVWLTLNPSEILPQLNTRFGKREIMIAKYSAGAFATSPIDNVLKEWRVATVFFVGADTPCCLFATVDGAYDSNYQTIVIEDGCLASRPDLQEAAIKIWAYRGFVRTTDQVVKDYPWRKWIDPAVLAQNDKQATK